MSEVKRTLLETAPVVGLPGWETRLFLIEYPAGADASGHSHPVAGIGYILTGNIVSAFEQDQTEIFTAGQSFNDPPLFHTISRNASDTEPTTFLVAYTVKVGEPVTVFP